MKRKHIIKLIKITVLAIPCVFVFNDINPITGVFNWWVNVIGIIYGFGYYHKILKPNERFIFKVLNEKT